MNNGGENVCLKWKKTKMTEKFWRRNSTWNEVFLETIFVVANRTIVQLGIGYRGTMKIKIIKVNTSVIVKKLYQLGF